MKSAGDTRPSLEEKLCFLRRPESYPEETGRVDAIETHMSWVFLLDRYVYKLKKPVRFELLNLLTLEDRRRNCDAEVRLNRRLAPDVYIGAVPLGLDESGSLALGNDRDVVDWLVKMRRLPARRMLDRAIERGEVARDDIRRLAEVLAAFYRRAPKIEIGAGEYRQRLRNDVDDTVRELEKLSRISRRRIEAVSTVLLRYVERSVEVFDRRVSDGRIVEGHGDLRPEHVCLLSTPAVIDCVEFSRELRTVDPVDELSVLSIECVRIGGAQFIEPVLFEAYSAATDDEPPQELIRFYEAFRAFLRARMAIWHFRDAMVRDAKWERRAERFVALAAHLIGASPELSAQVSKSSTMDPPS